MLDDFYQAELNEDPTVKVDLDDGDFFVVRYSKNKKFFAALKDVMKRHKRKLNEEDIEGKVNQKYLAPLVAKYLLVDWRITISKKAKEMFFSGLEVDSVEGEPGVYTIPFTVENATSVLKIFQFQPFLNDIYAAAQKRSNFADESLEDDIKN